MVGVKYNLMFSIKSELGDYVEKRRHKNGTIKCLMATWRTRRVHVRVQDEIKQFLELMEVQRTATVS